MRQLGEQWAENGRMYKAIPGKFNCLGCSLDNGSVMCIHKNIVECGEGQNFIIHDLVPVNEDGCLPCPFCGEYPIINRDYNGENKKCFDIICTNKECGCSCETLFYLIKQEAIDAWNRRA